MASLSLVSAKRPPCRHALRLGEAFGPNALIAGMTAATVISGTFKLCASSGRQWLSAVAGGLLMGIGATLVPGGNDAMLLTGVPLLPLNLLGGNVSIAATLALALLLRQQAVPMRT